MKSIASCLWQIGLLALMLSLIERTQLAFAQGTPAVGEAKEIRIFELQGKVEIMPAGASAWVITQTNQVLYPSWRLRTGENSRATLRWSGQSMVPVASSTEIEVLSPQDTASLSGLHVIKGIISFFHRDKPGRIRIVTRGAVAGIEGTEFVLAEESSTGHERTTISVIDGKVQLSNAQGMILLTNGEQAVATPGAMPVPTAGFVANNILQWCFYYPAVLDLADLRLNPDEQQALSESIIAYRSGDLLHALASYPSSRQAVSDDEQVYHAALLLAVGQVEETEATLAALHAAAPNDRLERLASALRTLIAAVKRQTITAPLGPLHSPLPSELLASSYYEQSRARGEESLRAALNLAREAVSISPQFGFAWERVAELEFGFGHTSAALEALNRSLELSRRNAQALALKGFLLAAENRPRQAIEWFDRAIATDAALGNAWLGRGLCKIRLLHSSFRVPESALENSALEDLLVAAALEPQRSLLRSYLGKAFGDAGDDPRANHELNLARDLDPNDPTAWLYAALLKQQQNSINEAISDLEGSQQRNDNRSLFRSRLMLDEDRAVRSANLAAIYRDAGMTDVSVREAARAVTYDYANDSAHLFLADSYNELRDPTRFNLRYETVWFNELLLANLLSPVGGGRLSQHLSQQEYSRLFESDGLHLANSTLARSDNKSVTELASQFGTFGWTSYSLDLDYDYQKGVRPNNDLSSIEWYSTIKQQITPQDTALVLVKYEDYHSGDNFQYYDPANARPHFRFDEYQHPIVIGGWNHEWSPGLHTLLLGGRLENEQHFNDKAVPQLVLLPGITAFGVPFDLQYEGQLEIYTAELNQMFQWKWLSLLAGARYQSGTFDTTARLYNPATLGGAFDARSTNAISSSDDFERITGYGYATIEFPGQVWLTGGLAYDDLTYPRNFRHPPISSGDDHRLQLGPKVALVWTPLPLSHEIGESSGMRAIEATLRGIYAKSLGGVSLDESYRLEPTQLAGFPQTFRSLISESVAGSVSAPQYKVYGGALDLKFPSGTYAGVQYQRLATDVRRTIGVFEPTVGFFVPTSTEEQLNYDENALTVTINQLMGREFVLGASYKFAQVKFHDVFPGVPVSELATADQTHHSDLHEFAGYVLFNHSSGLFARADATWYHQNSSGYNPPLPGDDFVQENVYAGYRFWHRRGEIMLGILNLSSQNYHLNPLNAYAELPRERSFIARLNFEF